ncbi:hypothetical protein OPIT5_30085 [Opitutaceae bacterium TAV5]|nr:hypothetical protein OPIT5_30085 [Opitutaceae bacterium TAV5]
MSAGPVAQDSVPTETLRRFPSPSSSGPSASPFSRDLASLLTPPGTYPVNDPALPAADGITPLFFDSIPWNGKPTRVFAWLGIPSAAAVSAQKLPGIVLVHGGGGTAYRNWVRLWMDRGYAAIAMDTCGAMPVTSDGMQLKTKRHPHSGVPFSGGGFARALDPEENQWPYHAVAAVIRAHSLLLSQPAVDPRRTGITGISWGGVLTEIAASLDPRFRFAAPVYGCGFLGENSYWLETDFQKTPPAAIARWIALWDPAQYLGLPASATPAARTPFLFVNGTNDKHFRPDSWRKTTRLAATTGRSVTRSLKIRMPHDHPPAGDPVEVTRFADALLRDGTPLPRIIRQTAHDIRWDAAAVVPVARVELVYTTDSGSWPARRWQSLPAAIDAAASTAAASIPAGATAWYFNLHDARGCIVSGEHFENTDT